MIGELGNSRRQSLVDEDYNVPGFAEIQSWPIWRQDIIGAVSRKIRCCGPGRLSLPGNTSTAQLNWRLCSLLRCMQKAAHAVTFRTHGPPAGV